MGEMMASDVAGRGRRARLAGPAQGFRGRVIRYAVTLLIFGAALAACTPGLPGRGSASWAPSVREIHGLRAIATAAPAGYSLFTAHGTVRFLPGMDLGATTPGHQPGELAITPGDYERWLAEMGSLGVRAVRIYTIHPPAFYQALAAYNSAHAADPIYLIQGVYLPNDIYIQKQDLYDPVATATFRQELRDTVAAVSGTLTRSARPGFASGKWTTDVSRWTAGWIIGVEWDPFATAATDRRNPHAPATRGRYFSSTPDATPTERWLAARMNDIATALAARGWTAPIAFANWPTVDPLRHPNEPNRQEDMVGVDANHVLPTRDWPGGTFASFHAYPYYPDFLEYQPSLQHFTVDGHADPYAAYLHRLLRHFRGTMPVLLLQMRQLGMAGGFVFEWTDEWYKKTWNTQLHQIPRSRVQLWHDMFTNEQYFGVVATGPRPFAPPVVLGPGPGGSVNGPRVTAWEDESCVYLRIVFPRRPGQSVTVGMDTIPAITGPPPPGSSDHRASYALVLDLPRRTGQAWVRSGLDPDQIDYGPIPAGARPAPRDGWRTLELVTDRPWVLPATSQRTRMRFDNAGLLRYGDWTPGDRGYDSQALWHLRGSELDLRIPWAMAGLSDPSLHQALKPLGTFRATSVTIPGIGVTIAADGGPAQQTGTIRWQNWQAVQYTERIKAGANALREAFAAVS